MSSSLGALKQVDAGLLNVGYAEAGPADGPAVLLLHEVPLPPAAEHTWWYRYYFATDRDRAGYEKYRREFSKLINLPQEAPHAFAQAVIDVGSF